VSELGLNHVHRFITRQEARDFYLLFQGVETIAGDSGDRDPCRTPRRASATPPRPRPDVVMIMASLSTT